jgi:hypothetical protein
LYFRAAAIFAAALFLYAKPGYCLTGKAISGTLKSLLYSMKNKENGVVFEKGMALGKP